MFNRRLTFLDITWQPWVIVGILSPFTVFSLTEIQFRDKGVVRVANSLSDVPPNGGVKSWLHSQASFYLCKNKHHKKTTDSKACDTYGQSLQIQYFFVFPLTVFSTGGWKKLSTSRRLSSRDGISSSIFWTSTSISSPSLSTSFGFPSDACVGLAVMIIWYSEKSYASNAFLETYARVADICSSSTSSSPLASSSLVIVYTTRCFLAATRRKRVKFFWDINIEQRETYLVWGCHQSPHLLSPLAQQN